MIDTQFERWAEKAIEDLKVQEIKDLLDEGLRLGEEFGRMLRSMKRERCACGVKLK